MIEAIIILPPREGFNADNAGAIGLVARRFAMALPGTMVLGGAAKAYPGIPYERVKNWLGVLRALQRHRPRSIEVHQQPRLALLLALLFRRARIMLFLHNDPLTMRGLKTKFERALMLRRLHAVVCVSTWLQSRYATGLHRTPHMLHNPLTLAELPPQAAKQNLILFAGRIVPDKGPDQFIAACAQALPQLPGWRACMIGGDRFGPDSPQTPFVAAMQAAAAQAGVAFHGAQPHAQVLDAMARAAIIAVPSQWAEPFGLTALEAMASGAALITTGQGGLAEVAGQAACLIPPCNAPALAAAIMHLARDPAARIALAQAGLARAKLFDTPVIAASLMALRAGPSALHPHPAQTGY